MDVDKIQKNSFKESQKSDIEILNSIKNDNSKNLSKEELNE